MDPRPRKRMVCPPVCLVMGCVLLLAAAGGAVTVDIVPTVPPIVSNTGVSDFYIDGDVAPEVFVLTLSAADETEQVENLQVRCRVLWSRRDASAGRILVYEGVSNVFSLDPGQVLVLSSRDFLREDNYSSPVYIDRTVFELQDEEFERTVLRAQRIPDGRIEYEVDLESALTGGDITTARVEPPIIVLNSNSLELVSPGHAMPGEPEVIGLSTPPLVWTSDLFPNMYGERNWVFEVAVYRARAGLPPEEVVNTAPLFLERIADSYMVVYPATAPRLIPGATYYWRVTAILKGVTTEYVRSPVYGFRIATTPDPTVQEVLALLRLVLEEETIEKVLDYDQSVRMLIDGQPLTVEGLREMVMKVLGDEYSLLSESVR